MATAQELKLERTKKVIAEWLSNAMDYYKFSPNTELVQSAIRGTVERVLDQAAAEGHDVEKFRPFEVTGTDSKINISFPRLR